MDIHVRPETPRDEQAIRHVNEVAFGRPNEADIADRVRASSGFVPDLSLVAVSGGQIVGHVMFSEATVQGDGNSWTVLALGPVAVLPAFQRKGVGTTVIETGLIRAAELGYRAVVLIGHPTYYPRFGFVPASRFGLKPAITVPDDVFMARLLRPDGLDGVEGQFSFPKAFDE